MTGSEPIAGQQRLPAALLASRTAIALSGLSPKALVLLLCARIGYTPPRELPALIGRPPGSRSAGGL